MMFKKPREKAPDPTSSAVVKALHPLPVVAWGPQALAYLGIPVVIGIHMVVVRDGDHHSERATQKLLNAGFELTMPNRSPPPEVLDSLPDPEGVVEEINSQYKRLDQSTTTFDYPARFSERKEQVVLIPNSFARLDMNSLVIWQSANASSTTSAAYDVHGNVLYPSQRTLIESLVKAAVDDDGGFETEGFEDISGWGELLRAWVSMMVGYLKIPVDVIDDSDDSRAVTWYSKRVGRIYEKSNGPIDCRVSKRLGSGKEMMYEMNGVSFA